MLALLALALASTPAAADIHVVNSYYVELSAIEQNESAGGLYKDHETMKTGMHKGTHAGGAYGLMPKTVLEILRWSKRCREKYGYLENLKLNEISEELRKNPAMDKDLAMTHWKRLRHSLTLEQAAYSWFNGWGEVYHLSDEDIHSHWYVEKFRAALQKLHEPQKKHRTYASHR